MKARFTHLISRDGSAIARTLVLLTVMFIWILIDAGNVYGQSAKKESLAKTLDGKPMMREAVDGGSITEGPIDVEGFKIKPNPSNGELVFDFEFIIRSGEEDTSVDIFDSMGRLAYHSTLNAEILEIGLKLDLSAQLPGTYIVVVRKGDQIFTKRLLKI